MNRTLIALAGLVGLVAQDADSLYKFKKGTAWTYQRTSGKKTTKIVREVVGVEAGEKGKTPDFVLVESKEFAGDKKEPVAKATLAWWVDPTSKHLMLGRREGKSTKATYTLQPVDAKEGTAWESASDDGKGEIKGTFVGTVELKVAAGTYKDTAHVRVEFPDTSTIDFYLAAKVGLVKMERKKGDEADTLELTEFKAAK